MPSAAIYPGSFDPVTFGHIDIIKRAALIFDKVVVAVANATTKQFLLTTEERIELIRKSTQDMRHVVIEPFDGLIVDYAQKKGIHVLIRGLRMISDFEYELQMALTNRRLSGIVETVFLMPSEGYSFLSSTLIKEAASLGANISSFVPDFVAQKLKDRIPKR